MIGRDKINAITEISDVDSEINSRQEYLNSLTNTLNPSIIAEEISELRRQREKLEEHLVDELVAKTGRASIDVRESLVKNKWDSVNTLLELCQ